MRVYAATPNVRVILHYIYIVCHCIYVYIHTHHLVQHAEAQTLDRLIKRTIKQVQNAFGLTRTRERKREGQPGVAEPEQAEAQSLDRLMNTENKKCSECVSTPRISQRARHTPLYIYCMSLYICIYTHASPCSARRSPNARSPDEHRRKKKIRLTGGRPAPRSG